MLRTYTASASTSSRPSTHCLSTHCSYEWFRAALELPRRTTCCISAAGGRDTPDSPAVAAPQQGREKQTNEKSYSGQHLYSVHTLKISIKLPWAPVELTDSVVEAVRASFLCEDMQNSRGGIAGLGDAATNLSPPTKGHFLHHSFPKKAHATGRRAGQKREGKGCPCWVGFLMPVTSLEKNLLLVLHTAWETT